MHFCKMVFSGIRIVFLIFIVSIYTLPATFSQSSIRIVSWNLKDFGQSKSDEEILFIAKTIKDFDIVMIQEVVAKHPGGAQAVGRLAEVLNRMGAKWDYRISDMTSGENSYKRERYAFLWKPSRIKLIGRPWLERQYNMEIDREPFFATFNKDGKEFTLVNFHAITKSKQPETEIKYFKYLPAEYPNLNLIFCGDFNCPQSHTVFNPLRKMGYLPALVDQRTSLRQQCLSDGCLASEYDNVWYDKSKVIKIDAGIIHFYLGFTDIKEAGKVSDHVPVVFEFEVKEDE
ncbi:endonuclease/exonuclease/phosphatase family protein [Candidatus Brachybacter algidus]|uniref:endonuclease/exonuclease/phosphatase family protein n=1 Tax=Candidatus Brachybacter algidus TaxID=2982024 RepID=UPI001B4269E3|nr:endonuclease/exonuclease/phosphatase family protein [Candidatus Brachybacter algidus]MBP8892798.1 endonuclease/exonuclease/phosphatase family protein [Saprospiraceae bacterium]